MKHIPASDTLSRPEKGLALEGKEMTAGTRHAASSTSRVLIILIILGRFCILTRQVHGRLPSPVCRENGQRAATTV